jgi:hypothetical protein
LRRGRLRGRHLHAADLGVHHARGLQRAHFSFISRIAWSAVAWKRPMRTRPAGSPTCSSSRAATFDFSMHCVMPTATGASMSRWIIMIPATGRTVSPPSGFALRKAPGAALSCESKLTWDGP